MTGNVFANRILNLKKIKYIGLDMDHTLIRYHTKHFESLVFKLVIAELINHKNYSHKIQDCRFVFEDAIRGLVIDSKNGNILKLNRFGAIRHSYHGTQPIEFADQKQFYRSIYVDLSDPNYMVIDTSFSIAFCCLFAQLIDLKDRYPHELPAYNMIAFDVLNAVDKVHADGSLKGQISRQLDQFVIKDSAVVAGLKKYVRFGKKIFIITNSDYHYTKLILDYAVNPYLDSHETWETFFEVVITLSAKPRFFYDTLKFLTVDPQSGTMTNTQGKITPGIYQGGNATQFTKDLGLQGDQILYIGDHIYGDIVRLKKDCNWRTALVVEELAQEIAALNKVRPVEEQISEQMSYKIELEQEYIDIHSQCIEHDQALPTKTLHALQKKIAQIDEIITTLLDHEHDCFNVKWQSVFRAGAEESYFAYQVDRYACIYMAKLADLLAYSPMTYFRAKKRLLPHDSLSLEI